TNKPGSADGGTESPATERPFGHHAILIAAAVGFVLGALVTAAFLPLLPKSHSRAGTLPTTTATPVPKGCVKISLLTTVTSLVDGVLGRYGGAGPNAGRTRVRSVCLTRVYPFRPHDLQPPAEYDLRVRFLLEPNPLGATIQIGGARTD